MEAASRNDQTQRWSAARPFTKMPFGDMRGHSRKWLPPLLAAVKAASRRGFVLLLCGSGWVVVAIVSTPSPLPGAFTPLASPQVHQLTAKKKPKAVGQQIAIIQLRFLRMYRKGVSDTKPNSLGLPAKLIGPFQATPTTCALPRTYLPGSEMQRAHLQTVIQVIRTEFSGQRVCCCSLPQLGFCPRRETTCRESWGGWGERGEDGREPFGVG